MRRSTEAITLHYLGHAAFAWDLPSGFRLLIDPFRDPAHGKWFLKPFPTVQCDIVMITHPHFDHDAIEALPGHPTILRHPVELRGEGFRIRGVMWKHARDYGQEFHQENIVFVIEASGLRFCHLGDARPDLPKSLLQDIGPIDVLMVPVDDSCHLLSFDEVDRLIHQLAPSVVIPSHYLIPGLTAPESTLQGIDRWLKGQTNIHRIERASTRLLRADLPQTREIWVFDAYVADSLSSGT
ncbi:MAG TPA: MBL fold metallo-hydrolase [Caldilineae bacterium]|nr:MBL fold metallo-hydrolase [Caldilineae bacterium]